MLPIDLDDFLERWRWAAPRAVALLGSYARGDAGPFSDVDLLFLWPVDAPKPERNSFLVDGMLVTVNPTTPTESDEWFTDPAQAVTVIAALRDAVSLHDPDGLFAPMQSRARAFVWSNEMQAKADRYASGQMVGWIEEAHKGLEGLRRNHAGRLLQARFGLSWGLAGLMQVQQAILSNSDNSLPGDVCAALGANSRWSWLAQRAFGLQLPGENLPSLHEEVRAGLRLYCESARLLAPILQADDRPLVQATVARIEEELTPKEEKRE